MFQLVQTNCDRRFVRKSCWQVSRWSGCFSEVQNKSANPQTGALLALCHDRRLPRHTHTHTRAYTSGPGEAAAVILAC